MLKRVKLRNYLLTGLLVAGPIFLTFYLAWGAINFVDDKVNILIPAGYQHLTSLVPGLGLVAVLVGLTFVGWLTSNFLGRFFLRQWEKVIVNTPFLGKFYDLTKQIFSTLFGGKGRKSFRQVVLLEFPAPQSWAIGFVTNDADKMISNAVDGEHKMQSVFLPTSPNPTSGYLLFRRKRDLMELPISVEEGMRLIISGGIVGNGRVEGGRK